MIFLFSPIFRFCHTERSGISRTTKIWMYSSVSLTGFKNAKMLSVFCLVQRRILYQMIY